MSLLSRRNRGLVFVRYSDAERLVRAGWVIAPEEDRNRQLGWVYLERPPRWSLARGRGCAALVLAALLALAIGLAWWALA